MTQRVTRLVAATLMTLGMSINADTVIGVHAGAGYWQADYSGDIGKNSSSLNSLGIEDDNHNFYYIALEHPFPLVPNIKLQYNDLTTKDSNTLSNNSIILGGAYGAGSHVTTTLDLTHTDAVFYYEVLDNWVNLDLGLAVRKFDGSARTSDGVTSNRQELDGYRPMGYIKGQGDLPLTGFSVAADLNLLRGLDDEITDYSVKVMYMNSLIPLVDMGVELGYRSMNLDLEDLSQLETDLTVDGPYLGINFHF